MTLDSVTSRLGLILDYAFVYRAVFEEILTTSNVNFSTLQNTNISYGSIYGNICNTMGNQPLFAEIRNSTDSFDVCFGIQFDNSNATDPTSLFLEDDTKIDFLLGFKKRE